MPGGETTGGGERARRKLVASGGRGHGREEGRQAEGGVRLTGIRHAGAVGRRGRQAAVGKKVTSTEAATAGDEGGASGAGGGAGEQRVREFKRGRNRG